MPPAIIIDQGHTEEIFKLAPQALNKRNYTQAFNNHIHSLMDQEEAEDYPALNKSQRTELITYLNRYVGAESDEDSELGSDSEEDVNIVKVGGKRKRAKKPEVGKRGYRSRIDNLLMLEGAKKFAAEAKESLKKKAEAEKAERAAAAKKKKDEEDDARFAQEEAELADLNDNLNKNSDHAEQ